MELASGWHSGFAQSKGTLPTTAGETHAGSDVEVCFSARSAPGVPRLSMCVLGLGYQSQTGDQEHRLDFHRTPGPHPRQGAAGEVQLGTGRAVSLRGW